MHGYAPGSFPGAAYPVSPTHAPPVLPVGAVAPPHQPATPGILNAGISNLAGQVPGVGAVQAFPAASVAQVSPAGGPHALPGFPGFPVPGGFPNPFDTKSIPIAGGAQTPGAAHPRSWPAPGLPQPWVAGAANPWAVAQPQPWAGAQAQPWAAGLPPAWVGAQQQPWAGGPVQPWAGGQGQPWVVSQAQPWPNAQSQQWPAQPQQWAAQPQQWAAQPQQWAAQPQQWPAGALRPIGGGMPTLTNSFTLTQLLGHPATRQAMGAAGPLLLDRPDYRGRVIGLAASLAQAPEVQAAAQEVQAGRYNPDQFASQFGARLRQACEAQGWLVSGSQPGH